MLITETQLDGAYLVDLERRADDRGFFARAWCRHEFAALGLETKLAQANISCSRQRGTLRGMHYQVAPYQEAKLIRCVRGTIYDVLLDIRRSSPTYRQWVGVELSEENGRAVYVPPGVAHGFLSLTDDAVALYLVTEYYTPDAERGIRYDDPTFQVQWPIPISVISDKDQAWPSFSPEWQEGCRL